MNKKIYIIIVLISLLYGYIIKYNMTHQNSIIAANSDLGQMYYKHVCSRCHGINGRGQNNTYPPLMQSKWVSGDNGILIRIVMDGVTGVIEVNEKKYDSEMSGWRKILDDRQITEILKYLRKEDQSAHSDQVIEQSEVRTIREQTKNRNLVGPWTAAELNAIRK
ncbi:MAG: cytochrome c [Verrucomicrobia bacterium]|nr:cytochrome c [Verrucomicrobiota bacterium]